MNDEDHKKAAAPESKAAAKVDKPATLSDSEIFH